MKPFILISVCASLLDGQAAEFEVATVKVNKSGQGIRGGCHGVDSVYTPVEAASAPPLGRCVVTSARLGHLINVAYGLMNGLVTGGPEWVTRGFDRFDLQAEAENPAKTTEAELRAMLRSALVERFDLKFHRETVERPGFALVAGKNGARIKVSSAADTSLSFGGQGKPGTGQPVTITARKITIAGLAGLLSSIKQVPIVDETGLAGDYDVTLNWDEDQGPTLATAVQEQLGLKLEAQKVPISLFVIDSAQKPSAN
jgi:uncharacterized protein (TIGR03435 family)